MNLELIALIIGLIAFAGICALLSIAIYKMKKELDSVKDFCRNLKQKNAGKQPKKAPKPSIPSQASTDALPKHPASNGSILVDVQIKDLCEKQNLLGDTYKAENVEAVSYDLTIDYLTKWRIKDGFDAQTAKDRKTNILTDTNIEQLTYNKVTLRPHEVVFVTTKETLNLPKNLVARVPARNRYIRAGLFVSSPLYQPGHNTKIMFAVYNMSDCDIVLAEGLSIAHVYFEYLSSEPNHPYDNIFQGEQRFTLPIEAIQTHISDNQDMEKKITDLEAKIYTIVTAFMGAFVSVLCLLVVNFGVLAGKSVTEIVEINISLAVCIVLILGMVFRFAHSLSKK